MNLEGGIKSSSHRRSQTPERSNVLHGGSGLSDGDQEGMSQFSDVLTVSLVGKVVKNARMLRGGHLPRLA